VLAKSRRCACLRRPQSRHSNWQAHCGNGFAVPGTQGADKRAGAYLRIRKYFRNAVDGPGRHADIIEALYQLGPRPLPASCLQQVNDLFAVIHPICIGAGERLVSQGRYAQDFDQVTELRVTADGNDHMTICGAEHLIGNKARVRIAHAARRSAGDKVVQRLVCQYTNFRVEQCQVDGRAFTAACTLQQRRLDGRHGIEAGKDICVGHASLLALAVRCASQIHDPAHGLHDEVIARPIGVGTILAEAGNRAVDERWSRRAQCHSVEPVVSQIAVPEILDDYIRSQAQVPCPRAP
jgi:hypothetical protein